MKDEFFTGSSGTEIALLPNKTLLVYGRANGMDPDKPVGTLDQYYLLLDTLHQVLHAATKPVDGNTRLINYLLNKENEIIVFYEEEFKANKYALHGFLLTADNKDDYILQLQPKFRYIFTHAVLTSDNTFVMPYLHNIKRIGLVQLKVKEE